MRLVVVVKERGKKNEYTLSAESAGSVGERCCGLRCRFRSEVALGWVGLGRLEHDNNFSLLPFITSVRWLFCLQYS